MKFLFIISLMVLVASCSKLPVIQTETIVEYRDTTIVLPGDTVKVLIPVDCPGLHIDTIVKSKSGNLKAAVKLQDNSLEVSCKADSLEKVIKGLQATTTTKYVPIVQKEPLPYIPKWMWHLLALVTLTSIWGNRLLIVKLFKCIARLFA